ncbi:MAG: tetratricopeptide repeat protein [Planctomycetota bacterium]|nr:tetratricopeptide repeat protein [Planctomycetota bacterium]
MTEDSTLAFGTVISEAHKTLAVGRLSDAAGHLAEARKLASHCIEHAQILDTFGAILAQKRDFKEALEHHLQAAQICRDAIDEWDGMVQALALPPEKETPSKFPVSEARYLANVGALAQISDKPALAERSLIRAYHLLESNPETATDPLLAEVAHNLGVFLMNVGKTTESVPFLESSLKLDQQELDRQNSPRMRQTVHAGMLRLCAALRREQKPESHGRAMEIAYDSLELSDDINVIARALSLLELGSLHFAAGDLPLAMEKTREAIDKLEALPGHLNNATIAMQLGKAYVDLSIYARHLGRGAAALQSLNRAAEQANVAQSPALTAMSARERAQLT